MLKELDDVALDSTTLSNGDELVYDATDRKWKNAAGAGGALFVEAESPDGFPDTDYVLGGRRFFAFRFP